LRKNGRAAEEELDVEGNRWRGHRAESNYWIRWRCSGNKLYLDERDHNQDIYLEEFQLRLSVSDGSIDRVQLTIPYRVQPTGLNLYDHFPRNNLRVRKK